MPAETQSGKVFRLRGKGVQPVRSRAKGDLYCQLDVEIPVNLSAEQKALLKQFEESLAATPDKHRPRQTSWTDGVRRFFDNMAS